MLLAPDHDAAALRYRFSPNPEVKTWSLRKSLRTRRGS
jgi:hypothetical protein